LLPHELTAKHIWDYRLYLARSYKTPRGSRLTKKSQNYYLIAVRGLLNFLEERDIATLSASKIKLAKQTDEATISFLDARDIELLLDMPDIATPVGLRDRASWNCFFHRVCVFRNWSH
jgi:integrase/recombinase XerD